MQWGGASPSTLAMLLQMVFEKYAKAALLRSGTLDLAQVRRSHAAASKMAQLLWRHRPFKEMLGGAQVWADVLGIIPELERAHPQITGKGPHLEYPWEHNGNICWPARDLPIAQTLGRPESTLPLRILKFAQALGERFDAIFP